MTAGEVLLKAAAEVGGDRQTTHGDARRTLTCIAAIWNGVMEARRLAGRTDRLDSHDVANMMEALKIARRYTGSINPDDYIDGAGYAAVAMECAADVVQETQFA